ncbi:MAG TPA: hypothetical protein QGF63_15605, partial [Alphaproteobacteria bacterium]|nr:hypothetical protein [Alphaproteobacteria bacterium]
REDQKTDRSKTPLEPSTTSGLTSNQDEPDPPVKNRLNSPECFDDGQSARAGHSSVAITLDVYGHLIEGMEASAADAVEGWFASSER